MSSCSRNIRRSNSARRSRALGAGLAFALMSGAALADVAHPFVFTAYTDATGGANVAAGRYRAALKDLNSPPEAMELDSSAIDSNRCVAYSMTLQWREARAACDAAVHAASEDQSLAVAYANRAVMYWLLEDAAAARKDLARAQEFSPNADFVARNIVALKAHVEVAQAGTPAPKS